MCALVYVSREYGISAEKLVALLQERGIAYDSQQEESGKKGLGMPKAHRALYDIVDWVCAEIREISPTAYDVIRICALAHTTGVRRSFFQGHPEEVRFFLCDRYHESTFFSVSVKACDEVWELTPCVLKIGGF